MDASSPRIYGVNARDREPLLAFVRDALKSAGCAIVRVSPPTEAPFRIVFDTPTGERIGIVAYAFRITRTPTRNRPDDEVTFQIKYGSKEIDEHGEPVLHTIWQDPTGLQVTLMLGIDPENGYFVAIDPVLHSPTKFFIRVEFKDEQVEKVLRDGWAVWERKRVRASDEPVEIMVGGTANQFLRYVRFERAAVGEDQGHRQLIAERPAAGLVTSRSGLITPPATAVHALARELDLSPSEVLDVIANASRLKMAVRGFVAEEHLVRLLGCLPGVSDCRRDDREGAADVLLRFEGSRELTVECKNTLRNANADQVPRIDLQRTRASKGDPCSRFYKPSEFDVIAGCLHARTERWDFKFAMTKELDLRGSQKSCSARLSNNVKLDSRWTADATAILRKAAGQR